jgi:DNA-binding transcriptional LysR family regulator
LPTNIPQSEDGVAGLQAFLAFAETAKRGSFAAAARELGLSASAVAKAVARLEDDLGLRLCHRTTRQVALTSDGHELYERCRRIVEEIDALRDDAAGARAEPSGTLRLNVPLTLGRAVVVPAVAALVRRYPRLGADIAFSDRYVDVVKEGLDAALRIGHLPDSSLVAQRVGEQSLVVCGAPTYLAARGTPRTPADLHSHRCLAFRIPSTGRLRPWQLRDDGRDCTFVPRAPVAMDDGEALVVAAAEGLGLMQVPDYMAAGDLRAGRLVEVLAGYRAPPLPIAIVYPSTRRVTPRLRALIAILRAADFGLTARGARAGLSGSAFPRPASRRSPARARRPRPR